MAGIGDMFSSFFNPEDAYKAAQEQVQQGWNQAQGYEKPYWQQGLDQYGNLMGAENQLLNPAQLESQWAQGYQQSPYAQQMLKQNQASGLDTASSMGLMGSSTAQNNIQQQAGNIVNQDRQQYMNDLMQKYMTGIGIGQNIYGIGANMGSQLGGQAMNYGNIMGGLKASEQAAPGALLGKLFGMGGAALANSGGPASWFSSGTMAPVEEAALTAV